MSGNETRRQRILEALFGWGDERDPEIVILAEEIDEALGDEEAKEIERLREALSNAQINREEARIELALQQIEAPKAQRLCQECKDDGCEYQSFDPCCDSCGGKIEQPVSHAMEACDHSPESGSEACSGCPWWPCDARNSR